MKKFAIILAVVAGSVASSYAGACGGCNNCPRGYYPGQCFTTQCGTGNGCRPACKPACRPVCKPVCKPVCNPCR